MKAALEQWRHWLEGSKHPFTVLTDHRKYLRSAIRLNHHQARWALFFTRFQFTVTYRPGSKNTKADALSHQFESSSTSISNEPILPSSIILAPVQWDTMTEITEAHQTDPTARLPALMCLSLSANGSFSGSTHHPAQDILVKQPLSNWSAIASGGPR